MYYSQEVKYRITKHKSTLRKGLTDLPVPANFLEKAHTISQLRFRVIDGVPKLTGNSYSKKESFTGYITGYIPWTLWPPGA